MKNGLLYPVVKLGMPVVPLLLVSGLMCWLLGFGLKARWLVRMGFYYDAGIAQFEPTWMDWLFLVITHSAQVIMAVPLPIKP